MELETWDIGFEFETWNSKLETLNWEFETWNLKLEIWNWKFETWNWKFAIWNWKIFLNPSWFFLFLKRFFLKILLFHFLEVDWVNLVKPELTQRLRWLKQGGLNFGPHSCLFLFFFFFCFFFFWVLFSYSFFLLPPLSLFTLSFHLHFLLHYTISSLKNHFPKVLNLPSLISLNIFSDPCILGHFCYTPILWKPFLNFLFLCITNDIIFQ